MEHKLKCWPTYYQSIKEGTKTFELRRNDRDFKVGDTLYLQEWSPTFNEYTTREQICRVTYILPHLPTAGCAATFGLNDGFVIMSIIKEKDVSI